MGESEAVTTGTRRELRFTVTSLGGLPSQVLFHLTQQERKMIEADLQEVARQEAKNCLEENLYKLRSEVAESSPTEKQIPVVYEGETPYTRQTSARPQSAPFDNINRLGRQRHGREDPFFNRSSFYNDPLFGW